MHSFHHVYACTHCPQESSLFVTVISSACFLHISNDLFYKPLAKAELLAALPSGAGIDISVGAQILSRDVFLLDLFRHGCVQPVHGSSSARDLRVSRFKFVSIVTEEVLHTAAIA